MSDRLPLTQCDGNYVSHGPYIVSFEWLDRPDLNIQGHIVAAVFPDLEVALFSAYTMDGAPFGEAWSPERRVVVDARGVTVLGMLEGGDPMLVVTREVIRVLGETGLTASLDAMDLLDWELEMMWNHKP